MTSLDSYRRLCLVDLACTTDRRGMYWPAPSLFSSSALAVAAASLIAPAEAGYTLQTLYQGESFFEGWTFWGNRDNLTNGTLSEPALRTSSCGMIVNHFRSTLNRCCVLCRSQ